MQTDWSGKTALVTGAAGGIGGAVNTPMLRTGFARRGFDPDTAVAELGKTVPLGRIAEPEDIADVILFLASDAARYMCGTVVEVNGGKVVK